jgi:hypothetical protein
MPTAFYQVVISQRYLYFWIAHIKVVMLIQISLDNLLFSCGLMVFCVFSIVLASPALKFARVAVSATIS